MTTTAIRHSPLIRATPFFYGWVMLAVGMVGLVAMGPSQAFTFGIYVDIFIADLGISRANVSLIYGLATFIALLLLPITGRLVDRYGPQRMVIITALFFGVSCMLMSGISGLVTLFFGCLVTRFLGFGSLQLVSNNAIAQWFIRKWGLVMGLAGQSLPLALFIYPWLVQSLMFNFGWRWSWVVMGVMVWLVMIPIGLIFFKDRPEIYGLYPDGDDETSLARQNSALLEVNWTLPEARGTVAFWLFAAAFSTMTLVMSAVVFHQVSLFDQRGLSKEVAIAAFSMMGVFAALGNLSVGYLMDRFAPRWLICGTLGLLAMLLIMLQVMTSLWHVFIYSACLGLISGSFRVLDAVVWAQYFGRLHLGAIKGATMVGVLAGSALGPYPLGLSFDYLGTYNPMLTVLLTLPLSLAIAVLFVKRPVKVSPETEI